MKWKEQVNVVCVYSLSIKIIMKKIIVVILTLLSIVSGQLYSQGTQLGAKFGANIFKVDGEAFDEKFRFGYHVGAFAYFDLGDRWGIQPELLWSSFSTKLGSNLDTLYRFGGIGDMTLDYVSVPLIISYTPSQEISLHVGPQFGILVNPNETTLENGENLFSRGDFSFLMGLQLNLGPIKTGVRYVVGLNDINDVSNNDRWSNQGFQLYIGLALFSSPPPPPQKEE